MPFRDIVTQELANLLGIMSHHDRILIVEALFNNELEVKALQEKLQISHSRVSQHLSLLRIHKVVTERRQGRHVFYRLVNQELSPWLMEALKFIEFRLQHTDQILNAVESARNHWMTDGGNTVLLGDEIAAEKLIYVPGPTKSGAKTVKKAGN